MIIAYTQQTLFKVDIHGVKSQLIRLMMFYVKLLIGFWILNVVIAEWPLNTIEVMPSTHEFFDGIIRKSKLSLFILF